MQRPGMAYQRPEHDNSPEPPDDQSPEEQASESAGDPTPDGATDADPAAGGGEAAPAPGNAESAPSDQAERAMSDVEHATGEAASAAIGTGDNDEAAAEGAEAYDLPAFDRNGKAADGEPARLDLLKDVNLSVKIELGRTRMYVEDVLRLNQDAVVELDKAAGDPVDIFVNGRLVARGEVLVLNENFCVRVSEIISQAPSDRR